MRHMSELADSDLPCNIFPIIVIPFSGQSLASLPFHNDVTNKTGSQIEKPSLPCNHNGIKRESPTPSGNGASCSTNMESQLLLPNNGGTKTQSPNIVGELKSESPSQPNIGSEIISKSPTQLNIVGEIKLETPSQPNVVGEIKSGSPNVIGEIKIEYPSQVDDNGANNMMVYYMDSGQIKMESSSQLDEVQEDCPPLKDGTKSSDHTVYV